MVAMQEAEPLKNGLGCDMFEVYEQSPANWGGGVEIEMCQTSSALTVAI